MMRPMHCATARRARIAWLPALLGAAWVAAQPAPDCAGSIDAARVLAAVNALRERGADCGEAGRFLPASPLRWNATLAAAADRHAQDLLQRGVLDHRDANGRDLAERIRDSGYAPQRWAENLAAGHDSLDEVMRDWRLSARHCSNLMQPAVTEIGLACRGPQGPGRTWVLTLARPAGN